ncbi:acyl-CoA dehydrogenase family protein [Halobacillus sp. BAB-2008]|uniref:acyl-CoA dehydrogenase family protein n=1 Tax=Halobacillus sp. BAB-2008 TaxID=1246484 RepID=UPI0002A4E1CE|nr:acyl-CoA dehydrogenase family protein [Halobacillus sp. BAB-2008]ELK48941.1 acyl-CoA dehydrogenase [Halobacillus sp. BAB-2008]
MPPVKYKVAGGEFLVRDLPLDVVFTPEERTEEHKMIGDTARQYITREIHPNRKRIESGDYAFVASKMKEAGELGLLAHSIPERFGGLGLDKMSKGIVGEALGSGGGYSVAHSNHTCIATLPITYFGSEEQKRNYLPKLASGEYIGAYCLTEPEAGSDALAAKTTAVMNEEKSHYLLNGTKIYITNASFSDTFIVYAKVDGKDFTAFIVEKDFPGLSIGPEEEKMGIKGSSTCSVVMEDCEVPVENVLGEIGKGHLIALNVLNLGRFNLGFAALGAAKQALQLAVQHTSERKQFGRAISAFPATKEKLARMAGDIFASESLLYRTAGHIESALGYLDEAAEPSETARAMNEHKMEAAICKVAGSETLDAVVDEALQLHGGAGFIKEYPIEQMYRDARINRIFEGTNEINRLLIAGSFLKSAEKERTSFQSILEQAEYSLKNRGYMRSTGELGDAEEAVALYRDLFLVTAGSAVRKYGKSLSENQEIMMALADLAMELYRTQSVVWRVKKSLQRQHKDASWQKKLVYLIVEDANLRIQSSVIFLLSDLLEGEERVHTLRNVSGLLSVYHWPDSIQRNREIAEALLEFRQYPN